MQVRGRLNVVRAYHDMSHCDHLLPSGILNSTSLLTFDRFLLSYTRSLLTCYRKFQIQFDSEDAVRRWLDVENTGT